MKSVGFGWGGSIYIYIYIYAAVSYSMLEFSIMMYTSEPIDPNRVRLVLESTTMALRHQLLQLEKHVEVASVTCLRAMG